MWWLFFQVISSSLLWREAVQGAQVYEALVQKALVQKALVQKSPGLPEEARPITYKKMQEKKEKNRTTFRGLYQVFKFQLIWTSLFPRAHGRTSLGNSWSSVANQLRFLGVCLRFRLTQVWWLPEVPVMCGLWVPDPHIYADRSSRRRGKFSHFSPINIWWRRTPNATVPRWPQMAS